MKKKIILFAFLIIIALTAIFAQENSKQKKSNEFPKIEANENSDFRRNQSGDWFLRLNINAAPPLKPEQLKFGMDLNFGAYYFLNHFIAVGGSIGFGYNPTLGSKIFYSVPILAEVAFQFEIWNFEIPVFLGIGGAFEHHSNNFLFGLVMKPEVGVFYRINSDWSVGATFGASIMPQWYTNPAYNYWGYILNTGISARYHM
ncbi:MAG: TP0733 family outer membrane beta-barrel protein [Treponemataceae bacterium]